MAYSSYQLLFSDQAQTTLTGALTTISTTLSVSAGAGALFPDPNSALTPPEAFVLVLISQTNPNIFEIVLCTSLSGDTLTVVRAQENTSAQAWSANDIVMHGITAGQMAQMNQISQSLQLAPNSIFYVNYTTGSDSNPGTSALPFKTPAGAVAYISKYIASSGVTINVADYSAYPPFNIPTSFIASWTWVGNATTPANCVIKQTDGSVNLGRCITLQQGVLASFSGFSVISYAESVISVLGASAILSNCIFACPSNSSSKVFYAAGGGINLTGQITINPGTGSPAGIAETTGGGTINFGDAGGPSVTLTLNTIACSGPLFYSHDLSEMTFQSGEVHFGGTATGTRYSVTTNSLINTYGAGSSFLPGSISGTTASGGEYI